MLLDRGGAWQGCTGSTRALRNKVGAAEDGRSGNLCIPYRQSVRSVTGNPAGLSWGGSPQGDAGSTTSPQEPRHALPEH